MILVQFPNSVSVIVNLDLTLNFVTLIGRPQCNGRFCWQASLLHLRPSFSSTRMITRTIYVQDLSSGTVLMSKKGVIILRGFPIEIKYNIDILKGEFPNSNLERKSS